MGASKIKSFSVYGLFGTSHVHIPFDEDIKILIGENGLGKTQVLNLFYCTLTRNFHRLSEFNFDKLVLTFSTGELIEIAKKDIDDWVEKVYKHPMAMDVIKEIGISEFEKLRRLGYKKGDWKRFEFDDAYISGKISRKYPLHRIYRLIEELDLIENKEPNAVLEACKQTLIQQLAGADIMYFPTFRRVEEDLHNLGYNEESLDLDEENTLIQFGMNDVQKRFNKIETTIDKLLKEGLAQFTKDILNVVIDESESSENILEMINEDDIDIILSRVGNLLPQKQKETVKSIVADKKFKNPLSAYLLQKLIEIYEKQKELDNSVKIFRDVCNKYLINKHVFYDESAIKIFIQSEISGEEISLSKLSSGEKQIISIFSKVYLSEASKRFIVLFDEPELSLSMLWQKQLLPDIINSNKCDFLLAVTHSPFIFDNELDKYAVGLSEYIKSTEIVVI